MDRDDGGSELSRARQRLESLAAERKNINRMAAEEITSWSEFRELRNEVESEEAELISRIDFMWNLQFCNRDQIAAYTQQPTYCLTSRSDFLEVTGKVCHNLK